MSVLVTDGNERSALAVTRALGSQGVQTIVGAELPRCLAGSSKYCGRQFLYPSPYEDSSGFVAKLLSVVRQYRVDVVFPMTDLATLLIAQHRKEFEVSSVVPLPSLEAFECLSNKYRLAQKATKLGVPVPETVFLPRGCVSEVKDQIRRFPVVVKPARSLIQVNGSWRKTSVHHAQDFAELCRLYQQIDYLQYPTLIQQRIEGDGQGLFVLMNHGEPVALFAHRRLREKPPSGGVSVYRESIALPKRLVDHALMLLQSVSWHGIAMVEFKVEKASGIPYLMEVNGRFWGSLQLAIDSNLNFPYLLYRLATGQQLDISPGYTVGMKSRWLLGDLDHLLLRLLKPESDLRLQPGSPPRLKVLLDFCRLYEHNMKYEVLRPGDLGPFFFELAQYLRASLSRTSKTGVDLDDGRLAVKAKRQNQQKKDELCSM